MALKFFGRGSGFTDNHTSAYFSTQNGELVIIDCPVTALQKLMKMDLSGYKSIYVLITHTHGDHIGGLGLFVQYAFFVLNKIITVVAPNQNICDDIATLFKIEGVNTEWYTLVTDSRIARKEWFVQSISTVHSPELTFKCYGYQLNIDGKNVIYTGDTSQLQNFYMHLISKHRDSILYVDVSVHYGEVHLKLEEILDILIRMTEQGIKVYLMHLDDVEAAKEIVAEYEGINVVEVE